MRLLTSGRATPLVCLAALLAVTLTATQSVAHPESDPDHGVNATTFPTLWAGDADAANATELRTRTNGSSGPMSVVAAGTDVPLDDPPVAAERWNRGDLGEFPETDGNTSIHPPNATRRNGTLVKDAYAATFAVQPSTRARLSPSEQPLYVAPNGTVLGTVDYRVELPPDGTVDGERVARDRLHHEVNETRLLVDGRVVARSNGSHTPRLSYDLPGTTSGPVTMTLEADVTVSLSPEGSDCPPSDPPARCDGATVPVETVTVRNSTTVVPYRLTVSGYRARYPDGDLGLVVFKSRPWLGYSHPAGDVRGVWRFYAARDEAWDTLVTRTDNGSTRAHSPLHPIQVTAYPIETGPTASPARTVTILGAYGSETPPPTLPAEVNLDVLTEPYTASYGIATRTKTTDHDVSNVTAHGLVRGPDVTASNASFVDVPINETNLTIAVVNATAETVTVRVTLRDAATGAPIATTDREGFVGVQGERLNTTANGTVMTTLPRGSGGVSARFEPGRWWHATVGYVGDSDVTYVRGTMLDALHYLYQLAVPVSTLLLGVFIVDRITGWGVWPPWREL